jgi:transcription antitermination factor NusG
MYAVSQPAPEAIVLPDGGPSKHSLACADLHTLRWYAAYTRSRHEKHVRQQLEGQSFECFLPTYESVHRWNDRNAVVSMPLFPGYLFVRIRLADRMQVVTVPGVVNLVGVHGRPSPIPDEELVPLRDCFTRKLAMEPHPYLVAGRRMRIKNGPLAETEGILVRRKGRFRLILSVSLLARSVAVEIDANDVVPASTYFQAT